MTQDTARDIVQKYHRAWTSGDIDAAMSHVADDITCRAPGIHLDGKDPYREFIGGFAPILTGIGDIAEFFTVKGGKIAESVLIFDRLSYGPPEQA